MMRDTPTCLRARACAGNAASSAGAVHSASKGTEANHGDTRHARAACAFPGLAGVVAVAAPAPSPLSHKQA